MTGPRHPRWRAVSAAAVRVGAVFLASCAAAATAAGPQQGPRVMIWSQPRAVEATADRVTHSAVEVVAWSDEAGSGRATAHGDERQAGTDTSGDSCRVVLLGAVPEPGIYTLSGRDRTLSALLRAGGGVEQAATGKLSLVRTRSAADAASPLVVHIDLYDSQRRARLLHTELSDGAVVVVNGLRDRVYVANLPAWVGEVRSDDFTPRQLAVELARYLPADSPRGTPTAWLIQPTGLRRLSEREFLVGYEAAGGTALSGGDLILFQSAVTPATLTGAVEPHRTVQQVGLSQRPRTQPSRRDLALPRARIVRVSATGLETNGQRAE